MPVSPSSLLDRSAAGLKGRARATQRQSASADSSVPGAPSRAAGGVPAGGANTLALSDGTRISFRAVDELPELVD